MAASMRDVLSDYLAHGRISFHTPGHKGRPELFAGLAFPENDLTELPELDCLSAPKGILLEAQRKAAQAFGSDQTFFLVNGATAGNLALLLTIAAQSKQDWRSGSGQYVYVDRYAHRSVASAFVLSGLVPRYVMPVLHPDFQLPLGAMAPDYWCEPDKTLAVHVTCPGYYGTALDLPQLISLRDELAEGIPILVDQAHGAHWQSGLFPPHAVKLGADAVLHSAHKTLSSLTQSALLHVQGEKLDQEALAGALEMVQSSSPSYLLMASLDMAVAQGACYDIWRELVAEAQELRHELADVYRVLDEKDVGTYGITFLDPAKILINTQPLGVSAQRIAEGLREEFEIEPELWDGYNILFVLGVGNKPAEVRKLRQALGLLAQRLGKTGLEKKVSGPARSNLDRGTCLCIPPMRLTPREAWLAPRRSLVLQECLGKIAAENVVTYPPGIPIVIAGEEITEEVMQNVLSNPLLQEKTLLYIIDE